MSTTGQGRTSSGEWVVVEGEIVKKLDSPICGFVGFARNVTQRVTAEVDYKESVEAMGTILNSVQDALLIHDKSGTIIQFNEKMVEMSGVDLVQAVLNPSTADSYYSPEDSCIELSSTWDEVISGVTKQLESQVSQRLVE